MGVIEAFLWGMGLVFGAGVGLLLVIILFAVVMSGGKY